MLYAGHLVGGQLPPNKQQTFSEKLLKRLNHMERQVQDMLVFVKGDMALDDVITCAELATGVSEEIEILLATNKVNCHWDNQCPTHLLRCHKDALIGAILNLVNNAIQAGGEDVEIYIELALAQEQFVSICVKDNGPGMDAQLLDTVKDVFVTTKAQGTGLGLSVVDGVARRHGGHFELNSALGEGTEARLLIPLAQLTAAQITSANSAVANG
jgi:two-component system sensor histidine kinase FlrB